MKCKGTFLEQRTRSPLRAWHVTPSFCASTRRIPEGSTVKGKKQFQIIFERDASFLKWELHDERASVGTRLKLWVIIDVRKSWHLTEIGIFGGLLTERCQVDHAFSF